MSSELVKSAFEGHQIRVVDKDGEPWFCLSDTGTTLGMKSARDFVKSKACVPEGVAKIDTLTPMGIQKVIYIDEGNLYSLVGRSNAENAIRFQRWVNRELIPTIRKTGSYNALPVPTGDPLLATIGVVGEMRKEQLALGERISALEEKIASVPVVQADKVQQTEVFLAKRRISHLASAASKVFGEYRGKVYSFAYSLLEDRHNLNLTDEAVAGDTSKMGVIEAKGLLAELEAIMKDLAGPQALTMHKRQVANARSAAGKAGAKKRWAKKKATPKK